jgi:nonribosomal peptide synthetase DhbF
MRHAADISFPPDEQPVRSSNLLEESERRKILIDWNATAYPVAQTTLPLLFEQQVERSPDAPALLFEDETFSYAEVNQRANRLAHHLISNGIGPENIVGLAIDRSPDLVIALLAVLKAGAAYLPLDPNYPEARINFMIGDARPVRIITNSCFLARLPCQSPLLLLDDPATRSALINSRTTNLTDEDRLLPLTPLNSG